MTPHLSKYQKIGIALAALSTYENAGRKKRKIWASKQYLTRKKLSKEILLKELDSNDFQNLRISHECFSELLSMVQPFIEKRDTIQREAIGAGERLLVTLRFLATGRSYGELKLSSGISSSLLSKLIPETCKAIYECLKQYFTMPSSEEEWKDVATGFEEKWNFSNCVGAMEGMHVAIQKPPGSGSLFYNYKRFCSVILFAVVNANYEFMYVHVGTNGSVSNESVLRNTKFYEKLIDDELNLPNSLPLPGSNICVPYVFVGNNAFALDKHIMNPYPINNITHDKRIYNYRLSRARNAVENTLGILASRFQVLRQTIFVNVEKVEIIALACCALHNYLAKKNPLYLTESCVDNEDVDNLNFRPGDWRQTQSLTPLCPTDMRECDEGENEVRNMFRNYFNNEGKVSFQEDMLKNVILERDIVL